MALLSFLVLLLASLVSGVSRAWTSGDRQAETFQNGRAVLELMSRDLAQAVISPRLQFIQNPGDLNAPSHVLLTNSTVQVANSDAVFFQTISGHDPLGNVSEVGYYLVDQTNSSGNHSFELKRLFVPQSDPTQAPAAQANPAFLIYQPNSVTYNTTSSSILPAWLNLSGHNFGGSNQTDFEYFSTTVSSGVVALWMRCLDGNGDPISWLSAADPNTKPIRFNSTAFFQPSIPGQALRYTNTSSTAQANLLPAAVEITIITLDAATLARTSSSIPPMRVPASPADVPDDIALMNKDLVSQRITSARTFSSIVKLKNALP